MYDKQAILQTEGIIMKLVEITYYPVKSMRGISADRAEIRPEGLPHDREWLLSTPDGHFITARQFPQLLLWQTEPVSDGLKLTAPDGESLTVNNSRLNQTGEVSVWQDTFAALHGDTHADAWLSGKTGTPCRLNRLGSRSARILDYSQTPLSFADGAPYLLANTASLQALNDSLETPVEMRRFRANLVFDGLEAYEEEGWKRIAIGSVAFDLFKPCTRCVMTTVDLASGEKHPQQQPLKTLAKTRKAVFGMNMVALETGSVAVGDKVEVLA